MPMTAKELREKRAENLPELEKLRDLCNEEGREWTAEDEVKWTSVCGVDDRLKGQIDKAERTESLASELSAPAGDRRIGLDDTDGRNTSAGDERPNPEREARDRTLALNAYARAGRVGVGGLSDDMRAACERMGYNPTSINFDFMLPDEERFKAAQNAYRTAHRSSARQQAEQAYEQRALSALSGSAGAYTVSESFIQNLEINKLAFSSILQVAEILRTSRGEPLHWPTADDTGNTGEIVGENATIDGSTEPTFARQTWNAYKFHAKMIKVPWELLEDSDFNIESVISQMLGERLGRISNTRFTTGTGASQPKGITVGLTTGKTTASGTAIAADELLDLINSIDDAYLDGSRFMFHKNILLALRKLKDGSGQYLWQPGMRLGVPDMLFSYPYTVNLDMTSTITSGDLTMIFGKLDTYKVRQVKGMRFIRLSERYAEFDQIAFDVFLRQDGHLLDAGTAPVKAMLQV